MKMKGGIPSLKIMGWLESRVCLPNMKLMVSQIFVSTLVYLKIWKVFDSAFNLRIVFIFDGATS